MCISVAICVGMHADCVGMWDRTWALQTRQLGSCQPRRGEAAAVLERIVQPDAPPGPYQPPHPRTILYYISKYHDQSYPHTCATRLMCNRNDVRRCAATGPRRSASDTPRHEAANKH